MFLLLLAYAAVMTFPLNYFAGEVGLDGSWQQAVNYFPSSQYKFGPDLIFTYGPLGFVYYPENIGSNLLIALSIRLCIWVSLITLLTMAYVKPHFPRPVCFLAVSCTILAHPLLSNLSNYMLAITTLLLIVWQPADKQDFWRVTLPISALAGIAFLMTQTMYVMLMLSFAAYFWAAYLRERHRPSLASMSRFAWVVVTPLILYLIYNPSLTGLLEYISRGALVAGGYSDAMSTLALPPDQYSRLGLLSGLLIGFTGYATWRRWLEPETTACVGVAFYFGMKHGVVRPDGHVPFVYGFALMLFAVLVLKCGQLKIRAVLGFYAVCAGLCIVSLGAMNPSWNAISLRQWDPAPRIALARSLFHWKQFVAGLDAQTEANLHVDRLPDALLGRIQQAPVVVFPWELAYGPANRLNLVPLLTLQAYAAFTHELDRLTAEHLLAETGPATRLLMEWKSVDERHPLLDVPATWEAIQTGFQPEMVQPNLLLLKKRDTPVTFGFRPLNRAIADIRLWQNVPHRDYGVSVSASLSPTLWGRARSILYKTNPVYMELETDHHSLWRFRVIPDVLRHPFVINCLPLNASGLKSLVFENTCQQKITRFRFSGAGLDSYSSLAEIAFAESPDERFRFAAGNEEVEWQSANMPTNIPLVWAGSVDMVNGRPVPNTNSAANPIRVAFGKTFDIHGWAGSNEKTGEAFEAIYLILGNQQLKALAVLRPDVVTYLHNPRLSTAGFEISVDTSTIRKGVYSLRLVGVTRGKVFYRCPGSIYLRVD